jgi:hypothetical protein
MDAKETIEITGERTESQRETEDRVCSVHLANDSSTRSPSAASIAPRFAGDNRLLGRDDLADIAWEAVKTG